MNTPGNRCVFDLLFRDGRDLRPLALMERKAVLRKLLPKDHKRLKFVDHLAERGVEMFKFATSAGMEGIVGKHAESAYEGRRSRLWLKMKQAGFHATDGAADAPGHWFRSWLVRKQAFDNLY